MNIAALPAPIRHLILGLLATLSAAALTYAADNVDTITATIPPVYQGIATVLIGAFIAWATPLVQSYGLGVAPTDEGAGE